jgi:hypothetical protein
MKINHTASCGYMYYFGYAKSSALTATTTRTTEIITKSTLDKHVLQ